MNINRPKCIYCSNTSPSKFTRKAHILSQFMGNFEPDIYFEGDVVCDDCNEILGNTIEKHFAEKSFEGLIARLHLRRVKKKQSPVILYDSDLLTFQFSTNTPGTINPLLFLAKSALEKIGIVKDPLLLLKKDNLHAFVFAEEVVRITSENDLNRLKHKVKGFKEAPWSLEWFGDRDDASSIAQSAIEKLGLKTKLEYETVNDQPQQIRASFSAIQNIDIITARFVAKIAFEYFAFCAKESGMRNSVFSQDFKPIREFIKDGTGNARTFVSVSNNNFINQSARQGNNHYFIAFEVVQRYILGKIAFMDSIAYQVVLGKSPFLLANNRIGSAHAFNLTSKKINKMYDSKLPPLLNGNNFSIYSK